MKEELLDEVKLKKEAYRRWRQGQEACEECTEIVQAERNQVRKANALLNLFGDTKGKSKAPIGSGTQRLEIWVSQTLAAEGWAMHGKIQEIPIAIKAKLTSYIFQEKFGEQLIDIACS
ncbi:hypothetical protein BTVI_116496 [Pitangus sulphuratus]|nr:hypothetical protein BTVI_116496 [Pitangus sulphuratus]